MKKIILALTLVLAIVAGTHAQVAKNDNAKTKSPSAKRKVKKEDVPKTVTESFLVVYPENPAAEWYAYPYYWDYVDEDLDLDSTGSIEYLYPEYYEVIVVKEGKMHHSIFHKSGRHVQTRKKIKKEELPTEIATAFNSGPYKDWKITSDHEIVYSKEPDMTYYKIKVKKDKQKKVLYYGDKNGDLLQVITVTKK
ncbi:MAG: hypothetical protein JWO58_951 [Chitinophagaceae bacterium]|nr:hypothetical protein [Chitinophagaceae bacterium]